MIGDTKVEHDETFFMQLSDARDDGGIDGTRVNIGDGQGTGTSINDDSTALSINDVTKAEGNVGSTLYTFTRLAFCTCIGRCHYGRQ